MSAKIEATEKAVLILLDAMTAAERNRVRANLNAQGVTLQMPRKPSRRPRAAVE